MVLSNIVRREYKIWEELKSTYEKRSDNMKEYYLNMVEERWLRGVEKMSLREKLYVFVVYGGVENGAG